MLSGAIPVVANDEIGGEVKDSAHTFRKLFEQFGRPAWIMSNSWHEARETIHKFPENHSSTAETLAEMRKTNADWWCRVRQQLIDVVTSAVLSSNQSVSENAHHA